MTYRSHRLLRYGGACLLLVLAAGCGGGGGGGDGTAGANTPSDSQTTARTLAGTLGALPDGTRPDAIELLDADGKTLQTATADNGTFQVDVSNASPPYLLRARLQDGTYWYAAALHAPAAGQSVTANLNPLTSLLIASLAPKGNAQALWGQDANARTAALQARYESQLQAIRQALLPAAQALGLEDATNFAQTAYLQNGAGIDALLQNASAAVATFDDDAILALYTLADPENVAAWTASASTIPAIPVSDARPPVMFGPSIQAATQTYQGYKDSVSALRSAQINQPALNAALQGFQSEASKPQLSMDTLWRYYRDMLMALGFPASSADYITRLASGGDPYEGYGMIADFFGANRDQAIRAAESMQYDLVQTDPFSGLATFRITIAGETYYQQWDARTAAPQGGRVRVPQASNCMILRYPSMAGGGRPDAGMYSSNAQFYNRCNYPVQIVTCIWEGGSLGSQYSGCTGGVEGPVQVQALADTPYYGTPSGPTRRSRAFSVCPAPAVPTYQPNTRPNDAFVLQWACRQ